MYEEMGLALRERGGRMRTFSAGRWLITFMYENSWNETAGSTVQYGSGT